MVISCRMCAMQQPQAVSIGATAPPSGRVSRRNRSAKVRVRLALDFGQRATGDSADVANLMA
jgi:hypothetical protein